MRTDHAAMRGCHGATYGLRRIGLKMMKPALFAGCVIVGLPLTSTAAAAHVKWFVNCNVSDDPLPVQAVFTATFVLFFTLFLILIGLGCMAERTALGANISQLLDRYTAPLHHRADDLLRSVAAVARVLRDFPAEHEPCPIGSDRALDNAIMTHSEGRDPDLLKKLDAIAGRVLHG